MCCIAKRDLKRLFALIESMQWIDRLFSLMYRRDFFGATLYSVLRNLHLYGIFAHVLGTIDTKLQKHDALPRFNIAVCANMSAGKSTLVNALLGKDLLPSCNAVTTAKITSVYDRDGMDKVFGCCVSKGRVVRVACYTNVNRQQIAAWNSDPDVKRIFLQSDLNGIGNKARVVVVHDTPGTNASQYPAHRDVTLAFLRRENPDALLYVVNFENMMSDDQEALLHDIYSLQDFEKNKPVVFAINKLDSADLSKENTNANLGKFHSHVREIGYSNYVVAPVAAKDGRLLKMALLGRAGDFTEKESDDFETIFHKFYRRMDVRTFWPSSPSCQKALKTYGCQSAKVIVAGVEYPVEQLAVALANTGIPALEELLENLNNQ